MFCDNGKYICRFLQLECAPDSFEPRPRRNLNFDIGVWLHDNSSYIRLCSRRHRPLAAHWLHIEPRSKHADDGQDLVCCEAPSRTWRFPTTECSKAYVARAFSASSLLWLAFQELPWIELVDIGAPQTCIAVNNAAGHLYHASLLEQPLPVENRILYDLANGPPHRAIA